MVEGVSQTYFGQCRSCNTGAKEHINTNHICRAVPLDNPRRSNPTADPTEDPSFPDGVLAQAEPDNNTDGGFNTKPSMSADLGVDPEIGGDSVYDSRSLRLMVHILIGGVVTSESKPTTSNDVDVDAPEF